MRRSLGFLLCWLVMTQSFAKGYQTFEENGKVGMKDDAGHVVLPPSFEALGWSDGNFSVIGKVTGYRLAGRWGIIDLEKKFITEPDYESLVYCGGDCLVARKKINAAFSKTGCINLKGEIKIPFIYDGLLVQGLRAIVFNLVNAHYYYGLTDLSHRILIPVAYKSIQPLGSLRFAVENRENKIALFGDGGNALTDFSIDSISTICKNLAIIYQNHLEGLINRDGVVRLETKFAALKINKEGKVFAQLPNEWLFINNKNETVKSVLADELKSLDGNRLIIRKGNALGVVDRQLNTLVPIAFESLAEIAPGKYLVKQNNKVGVIDENGKAVVPLRFDSVIFQNRSNVFRTWIKNLGWQLFASGKPLTGKFYEELGPANDVGFPAISKGFSGMINADGHEFIPCTFDAIAQPEDGLLAVKFKGSYGIINAKEDWLVAPQAFPLRVINKQHYLQLQPGNRFIKTYAGEIIYFTPYPLAFNKENFTEFLPTGSLKVINYHGAVIQGSSLLENVQEIFADHDGLRGIKMDGRYGFVDQQGRLRIANRYDSIGEFHEGLAAIKLIGKWGFVNTSDQIAINPNFDYSSYFKNGVAIVSRNKKFGLMNTVGKILLSMRYDAIQRWADNQFLLISSTRQGLADEQGNVLVEPRFDSLLKVGDGLLLVCRQEKWGATTEQGLNIIPMIYDHLEYDPGNKIYIAQRKSEWKEVAAN